MLARTPLIADLRPGGRFTARDVQQRSGSRSRPTIREWYPLGPSELGACVEPRRIVPQQFAFALFVHVPGGNEPCRFWEMTFAVRIIGSVYQDMIADEISDHICEGCTFRNFDALEIAPALYILARAMLQLGQCRFNCLGVLVEPQAGGGSKSSR